MAIPANLVKTKVEGTKLVSPLQAAVEALEVTDAEELGAADELLSSILQARRKWDEKMEPILAPLRQAKSAADALKREIDKPLEQLELQVKAKIRDYRLAEAEENRRLQAELDK